jgi:hypothetical protein
MSRQRIAILRDKSTAFTRGLLDVIEDKMLRCDPQNRSSIDKICTDLLHVLASLPKATTAEEISQTGAFAGGEESVLYPPSLSDISQEESSNWTLESPATSMMNGRDAHVTVSTGSGASRREGIEQDNHCNEIEVSKMITDTAAVKVIETDTVATATIQDMPPTVPLEATAQPEAIQRFSTNEAVIQPVSEQALPPIKTRRHRRKKSSKFIQDAWNAVRFWI